MILAVAPGTAPASNSPAATVQFVKYAQLRENGTVKVTGHYLCQPGALGTGGVVFVELQQLGVVGSGDQEAKCDDQKHKLTVTVVPEVGAFSPGSAAARAQAGSDTDSSFTEKQAEITIR